MALEVQNPRQTLTVTVSTAATGLSDIVDLLGYRPASIDMSTAWTAAHLTFRGGNDTVTLRSLFDDGGTEIQCSTSTVIADRSLVLRSDISLALMAHRFLQFRSGLSTAAVVQSTTRALTLVLVPV